MLLTGEKDAGLGGKLSLCPDLHLRDLGGRAGQQWMLNFRVRDINAMVTQLRGAGIAVDVDSQVYPNGRFARLLDPEGNPIQLWQPQDARGP